jgi:Tfp pilus assembly protein PilV
MSPQVYIPVGVVALFLIAIAIYASVVASQLQARAAMFDLNMLEQMESASVFLDRIG